jgi:hypothetical protein
MHCVRNVTKQFTLQRVIPAAPVHTSAYELGDGYLNRAAERDGIVIRSLVG